MIGYVTAAALFNTSALPDEQPPAPLPSIREVADVPWRWFNDLVSQFVEDAWTPDELALLARMQTANIQAAPAFAAAYPSAGLETIAAEIRAEVNRAGRPLLIDAARQSSAAEPYPLPLVGAWAKGHNVVNAPVPRTVAGVPPKYEYQLLQQGRHLLPWFGCPAPNSYGHPGEDALWDLGGEPQFLQTCSTLSLPISFIQGGQWEQLFDPGESFSGPNYIAGNYYREPAVQGALGSISPAGTSNASWAALGARAGSPTLNANGAGQLSQLGAAAQLYPNGGQSAQRVFFLSNDEMKRDRWSDVPEYAGYDPDAARAVWGARFSTVYKAMFQSFRRRLPPAWSTKSSFVSYKAFGFDGWSRFGAWWKSSHHSASFGPSPFPAFWDGAAVQTFPLPGDVDHLVSPFADAMNFVFMADAALAAKPNYWQEITIRNDDDSLPAERWGAFCRHAIWLLRPRVVRIWESSAKVLVDDEAMQDRLNWTLDEVDSIWADPTLRRFWQWGRLLPNDDADGGRGPYQVDAPPSSEIVRRPRWFRLTVDRYGDVNQPGFPFSDAKTRTSQTRLVIDNPGRTDHYNQTVDVWSIALVNGPAGQREWLVYLFSSASNLDFGNVILSLPDDLAANKRLVFKSLYAHRHGKYFYFTESASGQPTPRGEIQPPVNRPLPKFERITRP